MEMDKSNVVFIENFKFEVSQNSLRKKILDQKRKDKLTFELFIDEWAVVVDLGIKLRLLPDCYCLLAECEAVRLSLVTYICIWRALVYLLYGCV